MNTKITIYKNRGQWRWRMLDARNNKIIGASTEGYKTKSAMFRNIYRVTGIHWLFLDWSAAASQSKKNIWTTRTLELFDREFVPRNPN